MNDRLVIFTRYPEPGKAKTRLIPALGDVAAAELHRQMTERTLTQVRLLQQSYPVSVEVWFAGGDRDQMQTWLGADLYYQPQPEGDLGDRMSQAFQVGFDRGVKATVIIGTDCPELETRLLTQAFENLQQTDLVLGPATDGGYYLIGLRRFESGLFRSIAWSTDRVFEQTVEIATQVNLSIACLPMLTDIDRPEDLSVWHQVKTSY
ncbi:TIGR04282 family arsenosugar biosynthesis glycosyltransferase [Leptolyngbya sp. NIES-2104]|uniref:TIGR04282 family arsenosugar biosynthesis glycosyltransferase n=1 Tax=Leptolyngbya sp. NIES-2104 TaxID=1552121 RepID=UPI0006EC76AA|nr:TIGR04282 family arsenosugar biosynthesis glycosyltransferase [Leptolyngbya sp. NIES-2104]GAP98218.1 glycosyltransferase [Leptolyngbya sp. NIES-2104]